MKRNKIYTLRQCTIEVTPGGQTATATRHDGKQSAHFKVIAAPDAPTPEVQAQRWAMGLPEWKPATQDDLKAEMTKSMEKHLGLAENKEPPAAEPKAKK